jgi:transcriptional regulator with XRE-family HTH domain
MTINSNSPLDPKRSLWDAIAVYLRHCRQQRGLSGESLGRIIGASKSTVSKIENGHDRLDAKQAALLDVAWETGGLFAWLVFFASIGHRPQWLADYVGFEQTAAFIRIFEPNVITALLQTEDYARALLVAGGSPELERHLTERLDRQSVVDRAFVTVVLSENALRWPVGSPAIMRDQLAHVLKMSEHPNVLVQVVPATYETGAYQGLDGGVQLLNGDNFGEVVYTESLGGGRLVSEPGEVGRYGIRYARIIGNALNRPQSQDMIRKIMEEVPHDDDGVAQE